MAESCGNKELSILSAYPLRGERGYFHRVDGIMTWAEGGSHKIDEVIGVVTRFEDLN